jgi:hypothetical protein
MATPLLALAVADPADQFPPLPLHAVTVERARQLHGTGLVLLPMTSAGLAAALKSSGAGDEYLPGGDPHAQCLPIANARRPGNPPERTPPCASPACPYSPPFS